MSYAAYDFGKSLLDARETTMPPPRGLAVHNAIDVQEEDFHVVIHSLVPGGRCRRRWLSRIGSWPPLRGPFALWQCECNRRSVRPVKGTPRVARGARCAPLTGRRADLGTAYKRMG